MIPQHTQTDATTQLLDLVDAANGALCGDSLLNQKSRETSRPPPTVIPMVRMARVVIPESGTSGPSAIANAHWIRERQTR